MPESIRQKGFGPDVDAVIKRYGRHLRSTFPMDLVDEFGIEHKEENNTLIGYKPFLDGREIKFECTVGGFPEEYSHQRRILTTIQKYEKDAGQATARLPDEGEDDGDDDHEGGVGSFRARLGWPVPLAGACGVAEAIESNDDVGVKYTVTGEDTFEVAFEPALLPVLKGVSDSQREVLRGEKKQHKKWQCPEGKDSSGMFERYLVEFPTQWAKESPDGEGGYGFSQGKVVGFRVVVRDGEFALTIDMRDDAEDRHYVTGKIQEYANDDKYAVGVPRSIVHGLGLETHELRLLPEQETITITPHPDPESIDKNY